MFSTKVNIPVSSCKIGHEDNTLVLGSCFSENIGRKLEENFFSVVVNPFGVLYNPVSIYNSLNFLLDGKRFSEKDLFYDGSLWYSFSHSTLFSDPDMNRCLENINSALDKAEAFLSQPRFLIITFGTAWVFQNRETDSVVSNCHKLPATQFVRYRLSVEEIKLSYIELIEKISARYPEMKIIFTVSPIRHWKDGAHENNVSKSVLLLAIDELQKRFDQVSYFPAYEILMDELRDYRYYADDMLHPSALAASYIWERFSQVYFSDSTLKLNKELGRLVSDMSHRPIHPDSAAYRAFLEDIEVRKKMLKDNYPFLGEKLK